MLYAVKRVGFESVIAPGSLCVREPSIGTFLERPSRFSCRSTVEDFLIGLLVAIFVHSVDMLYLNPKTAFDNFISLSLELYHRR